MWSSTFIDIIKVDNFTNFFSANFICNFEMNTYPFDVQACYLNLTLTGKQLVTTRYF